jgi:hypothetical protein
MPAIQQSISALHKQYVRYAPFRTLFNAEMPAIGQFI